MTQPHSKAATVIAALALIAAACSGTAPPAPGKGLAVALTDFKIAAAGTAPVGAPFTLEVRNAGKVIHSMAIQAGGTKVETPVLKPGESAALHVPALGPGGYRIWCTVPGHREAGMEGTLTAAGTAGTTPPNAMSPEQMDRDTEAGIKAFPAKTSATGGAILKPVLRDGVKEFDLAAKAVRWEVTPGEFVEAFAFNGVVPGPEIRVRKGDRVRVVVHNELPESTSVHIHGVTLPNAMDGVPFITQPPIKRGETFRYEFDVVDDPGTFLYHSHHNAAIQVGRGMFGAFIVEPASRPWNAEHTLFVGDGDLGYNLNGKGFPATAPIAATRGQNLLIRFLNSGQMLHPMHMHGFHFRVVARDGRPIAPYVVDTLTVGPGERYDAVVVPTIAGVWAFHCHILNHVEGERGMFGMVTAVVVT